MFSRILPVETGGNIMSEITTVVLDAMGGDKAPFETIKGAMKALEEIESLHLVLVGKKRDNRRRVKKNTNMIVQK